jgi:hypothetical protein
VEKAKTSNSTIILFVIIASIAVGLIILKANESQRPQPVITSAAQSVIKPSATQVIPTGTDRLTTAPDCISWTDIDANYLGKYICAYSNYAQISTPEEISKDDDNSELHNHFAYRIITLNLPGNSLTDHRPFHVYISDNQISGYSALELAGIRCLQFWGTIQVLNKATEAAIPKRGIFSINTLAPINIDKVAPCE